MSAARPRQYHQARFKRSRRSRTNSGRVCQFGGYGSWTVKFFLFLIAHDTRIPRVLVLALGQRAEWFDLFEFTLRVVCAIHYESPHFRPRQERRMCNNSASHLGEYRRKSGIGRSVALLVDFLQSVTGKSIQSHPFFGGCSKLSYRFESIGFHHFAGLGSHTSQRAIRIRGVYDFDLMCKISRVLESRCAFFANASEIVSCPALMTVRSISP